MSNEGSPPPTPTTASNRRASISRQTLADLFGRSPPTANGTPAYPGPIATAAANAQAQQRRRNSVSQALAGSPTASSPFSTQSKNRQGSFGSNSPSTSIDENAVEDGDAPSAMSGSPTSPFMRRVSFGARALKDARGGGSIGTMNGRASTSLASAPSVKGRGEGFDWSEQIKNRAERSASMTQRPVASAGVGPTETPRSVSTTVREPPIKEMPKEPRKPDHFQERILKGDFYMD